MWLIMQNWLLMYIHTYAGELLRQEVRKKRLCIKIGFKKRRKRKKKSKQHKRIAGML